MRTALLSGAIGVLASCLMAPAMAAATQVPLNAYAVGLYGPGTAPPTVNFYFTSSTPTGFENAVEAQTNTYNAANNLLTNISDTGFTDTPGVIGFTTTVAGESTGTVNFWAYCVDILHGVNASYLGQQTLDTAAAYSPGNLVNDGATYYNASDVLTGPDVFEGATATVPSEVQYLVNAGVAYVNSTGLQNTINDGAPLTLTPTQFDNLAVYQVAIWDVEYGLQQNSATDFDSTQFNDPTAAYSETNALITDAVGAASMTGGQVLSSPSGAQATIAYPALPEPSTWALFLSAMFGLGAVLRSRRTVRAA